MKHYQDPATQQLWAYELDGSQDHLIPPNFIPLTDAEAEAIRLAQNPPPDPRIAIQAEIDALERTQLLPRATREFMLLSMESMFTPEQLALNPGYTAVKAFDKQVADLRAKL